jgi:hypothetical protein
MSTEDVRKDFYIEMQNRFGFTEVEVQKILSKKFKGFNARDVKDYVFEIELAKLDKEKWEETMALKPASIPLPPCPRCGGKIHEDPLWGWRCEVGGLSHNLEHRANEIRRKQGMLPIFPEEDAQAGAVYPGRHEWVRPARAEETPAEMEAYLARTQRTAA